MKIMEEVRRNGYAVTTGYFAPGRRSIAVSIPSRTDRVPFAIGVAGTIERIEAKRELILQALRAFQAAALDSDFVDNDNLAATPLMTTGAASEAPRPVSIT
jgi:DNA-binding IclR family transcriptional regulator